MDIPLTVSLLIPLAIAAPVLAAPAYLSPEARKQATHSLLTLGLLCTVTCLLMIRLQSGSDALTPPRLITTALAVLVSSLTAIPLLDRARVGGLTVASLLVGIFSIPLLFHALLPQMPVFSGCVLLYAALIIGCMAGLGGSLQLPLSPARFTADGTYRFVPTHANAALGWGSAALVLGLFHSALLPVDGLGVAVLVSAAIAATITLLRVRAVESLHKAAEAVVAGMLLTLAGDYSLEQAVVLGAVAAFVVLNGEALAHALRLDDPAHLVGTVFIPTLLGMLAAGLFGGIALDAALEWMGASLALGAVVALLLWPLTKLTLGLSRI